MSCRRCRTPRCVPRAWLDCSFRLPSDGPLLEESPMTVHSWIQQLLNRTLRSAAGKGGHRRPEQRRKRSAKVWLEALEDRLAPAILIVNSTADSNTANSVLSVREAILLVNHAGNAPIALGRGLTAGEAAQVSGSYGSNDTIQFASSLNGQTITLTSGELLCSKNLSVTGPGANLLTVSGNNDSRVFKIASGTTVSLSGLTITKGYNTDSGGGIQNDGTLTLSNSTLASNSAFDGGGIYNNGTLTLSNSTLASNSSAFDGGGILNSGTLTFNNSTLAGNSANYGGGIYNTGTLTFSNSTLASNSAFAFGGGIYNNATQLYGI